MNSNKISIEEINALREATLAEKKERQRIKEILKSKETAKKALSLSDPQGLIQKILIRGYEDELLLMLEFTKECAPNADVQLFIYENRDQSAVYAKAYRFVLNEMPLSLELVKKLLETKGFTFERKLIAEAESYFVKSKLENPPLYLADLATHFAPLRTYLQKYRLEPEVEQQFIEAYLTVNGRDSFIDYCQNIVSDYVLAHKKLETASEKTFVKLASHKQVMKFIDIAEGGLTAEEELFERADREEVTAYFKRYATL